MFFFFLSINIFKKSMKMYPKPLNGSVSIKHMENNIIEQAKPT